MIRRALVALVGLALIGAVVFLVSTLYFKPWSIDHFYARTFARFALDHPMLLTQLGLLDELPVNPFGGRLDDFSLEFRDRERRRLDRDLATLRSYDTRRMTSEQRLSRDVLEWFLANQQEGGGYRYHDYPVNQLDGFQSQLPNFMLTIHPLKRPRDAAHYVERIGRFGSAIDQTIAGLERRDSLGVVPPRFVLRRVLDEMRAFIASPARKNPLYVRFDTSSARIPGLDPGRRAELLARLERDIEGTVVPGYRRLIAACERLAALATDDDGVWKLPDGAAYYDWCLRNHTTTNLSADSIHALGLAEVARLRDQMSAILEPEAYPGDLGAAFATLQAEARFRYPEGDSGRAQILADYRGIIAEADRRSRGLFGVHPKAGVTVERLPRFQEASSPGAYYNGSTIGGGRPGTFYVNLRDPGETWKPDMRTLAHHEAIPGHHLQISIAQELTGVPFFRRIIPFTAYVEGWGLYAEHLALEQGFMPAAFDSLGALRGELFRATRLVVDTGIHRKRWTRRQAIDYMMKTTGIPESEVVSEIERYIVNPGQACAYKIGELEIVALRERARRRLGAAFDLRRFHDVVLGHGALPLSLLGRVVDGWIAAELRSRSG